MPSSSPESGRICLMNVAFLSIFLGMLLPSASSFVFVRPNPNLSISNNHGRYSKCKTPTTAPSFVVHRKNAWKVDHRCLTTSLSSKPEEESSSSSSSNTNPNGETFRFNYPHMNGTSATPSQKDFLPKPSRTETEGPTTHTSSLSDPEKESTASVSTSILSINPSQIEIAPLGINGEEPSLSYPFVKMFRGSANYIANHRNSLVVYHIPGEFLERKGFAELMDDIALTWLLGMKIVIVVGCRPQIDSRLSELSLPSNRHKLLRITNLEMLRYVKEEAGYARFEVERQLNRAFRIHTNIQTGGNVISGNFYAAQPFGVIDGVDYEYTGIMRRVEVQKIQQIHGANDIVLLTSLGCSPSGEVFNVNSECLAAGVAAALGADKIIYFTDQGIEFRSSAANGKVIQSMRLSDAKNLLDLHKVKIHKRGYASVHSSYWDEDTAVFDVLLKIGWATSALERGVKRAHLIAPTNGSLLQEMYTRDGAGTLISRDLYEGIRRADVNDVAGIYDLVQPLVDMGTLVPRPKSDIEKDILSYYVYTRDDLIVACGQLKRFEGGFAEIGCLVVSRDYRSQGRGDAMLGFLERLCVQSGVYKVFVLSTQTMDWFVERGFREVEVESLPPSRRESYNYKRRSKIYMKMIDDRDLDADELIWDR